MRYHEINEAGILKKFGNRVLANIGLKKDIRDKAQYEINREKYDDQIESKVKKYLNFYIKNHSDINNESLYNFLIKNNYSHDDIVKAFNMSGIEFKPLKKEKSEIVLNPILNYENIQSQIERTISRQKIQSMNSYINKLHVIDDMSVNMMSKIMLNNFSQLGYMLVKNMYKQK